MIGTSAPLALVLTLRLCISSVLKLFSDKKRVETALEQCGLVNNRVTGSTSLCAFPLTADALTA